MKMIDDEERYEVFVRRCVSTFEHSLKCNDAGCRLGTYSCEQMKKFLRHTRNCRPKPPERCMICAQFVVLCFKHARRCDDSSECPVPCCGKLKKEIEQHEAHARGIES